MSVSDLEKSLPELSKNAKEDHVPALDPQVAAFYGDRLKNAPLCPPSLEEARANADATFHDRYGGDTDERFVAVKRTEDLGIPASTELLFSHFAIADTPHTIPARLYVPLFAEENRKPLPIVLYFHGGGFIMHNIASHDSLCRALAARCGCLVLSVGYRLAPENPYPADIADGFSALIWAHTHAAKLGGDPKRLILAGDSAGATISAALSLMLRDLRRKTAAAKDQPHTQTPLPQQALPEISLQILCYGSMGCIPEDESASVRLFGAGSYVLPRPMIDWCLSLYAPNPAAQDPYLNPGQAADLTGLPPTLSVTAECDPLRDDGEAFAFRLSAAGNRVVQYRAPGMMHGFLLYWHKFDRTAEVFDLMAKTIQKISGEA